MTVAELIEKLKEYPQSYKIQISLYGCGTTCRENLKLADLQMDTKTKSIVIDAEYN